MSNSNLTIKYLNKINFAEIETLSFEKAHEVLGKLIKKPLKKIIKKKLDKISKKRFIEEVMFVKKCVHLMKRKALAPKTNEQIKKTLQEYFLCLSSWAKGAQLITFKHQILEGLKADRLSIRPEDLALWLQNDNFGCQTGMIRVEHGKVIFWHTEEDIMGYINEVLIASFKIHHEHVSFFVYPHLLPGSTFSWTKDFFMAVDSLPIKYLQNQIGSLANITTWIIWRLANKFPSRQIIKLLSPHIDGYAVNIVRKGNKRIIGEKLEFGGGKMISNVLPNNRYRFLFQTYLVSNPKSLLAKNHQKISSKSKEQLSRRIKRTQDFLHSMENKVNVKKIFRMLSSRQGQDYAYANKDVKAHLIGKASDKKMELWLGKGPARKEEFLQYLMVD